MPNSVCNMPLNDENYLIEEEMGEMVALPEHNEDIQEHPFPLNNEVPSLYTEGIMVEIQRQPENDGNNEPQWIENNIEEFNPQMEEEEEVQEESDHDLDNEMSDAEDMESNSDEGDEQEFELNGEDLESYIQMKIDDINRSNKAADEMLRLTEEIVRFLGCAPSDTLLTVYLDLRRILLHQVNARDVPDISALTDNHLAYSVARGSALIWKYLALNPDESHLAHHLYEPAGLTLKNVRNKAIRVLLDIQDTPQSARLLLELDRSEPYFIRMYRNTRERLGVRAIE